MSIHTVATIQVTVKHWRSLKHRVGFTNGCFDILHVGHLLSLTWAKDQCDKLIVGIDNDESVLRLKRRLIFGMEERAAMIEALKPVDAVVVFSSWRLDDLVAAIKPDVLVKGAEYSRKQVVGAAHAKEVLFAPMWPKSSTTRIIERIKSKCATS